MALEIVVVTIALDPPAWFPPSYCNSRMCSNNAALLQIRPTHNVRCSGSYNSIRSAILGDGRFAKKRGHDDSDDDSDT